MGQKVEVGGTGRDLKGGKALIGGTAYTIKKGRTLIGGTGYDIKLDSGVALEELPEGTIVYATEGGTSTPFYIAKHDYESALNGVGRTLIVRKECYDLHEWNSSNNAYANSVMDSWLNGTYINLLSDAVRAEIGSTKFYYTPGNGNNTATTLQRAIFLLSLKELDVTANGANAEGTPLAIASTLLVAYNNGTAVTWWTRTPDKIGYNNTSYYIDTSGVAGSFYVFQARGSRPAFTLPGSFALTDNGDGTYALT